MSPMASDFQVLLSVCYKLINQNLLSDEKKELMLISRVICRILCHYLEASIPKFDSYTFIPTISSAAALLLKLAPKHFESSWAYHCVHICGHVSHRLYAIPIGEEDTDARVENTI